MDIKRKAELVIKELQRFREYPVTVLFSGGKDSLASLLLALDAGLKYIKVLYVEVTGNTDQKCNEYVHRICEKLGIHDRLKHVKREDLEFFECMKKWGIPIFNINRWCLWEFKDRLFRLHATNLRLCGMKSTDSVRRKHIKLIERFHVVNAIVINPIWNWSTYEVLDYIKERGVEINPCYRVYGHSGNCMFCPYHSKEKIILTMQDPYWREKILTTLLQTPWKSRYSQQIAMRWIKYAHYKTLF